MDNNNMNVDPQMDPNQQMDATPQMNPNQQTYANQQMDPNQQMYNQQMYGGQMDPNQQMYNQQMYGGQMDPNQQMYNQQMYGGQTPSGEKKSINLADHKNLIICIAAGVVALVLVVALFRGLFSHGKQSPKAIAKAITSAYQHEKPKQIYKLYDRKYLNYLDDEWRIDKDDMIDIIEAEIDDFMDDMHDWYDVGKVKRIKIDIEDVDKEKGRNLNDIKDDAKDEMGIRISQYATVEFEWEVIGKDDDEKFDGKAEVYKRMGKWYLVDWSIYY